jgi:DNA-binding LacI/PurR family transcriptional regulator
VPEDRSASSGRPRLADVAAHVGLSPASVSLVLRGQPGPSQETRARVLEAAEALGYRADRTASLLARRRSGLFGLLIDVHSAFHAELVEHVHAAAERAGYDVVLSTTTCTRSEARAVETLLDFRCEAVVLLGPEASAVALQELDRIVPVVVVGRRVKPALVDVVRSADDRGVRLAVDHLVGLGHTDIAFVDGGRGTVAADRRRGYREAMRRHGLVDGIRVVTGDHTESGGARAAQELLELRPSASTAVLTSNDRAALGLLDVLSRAGVRVPQDVSVVGYDDSSLAQLAHVDLTSVNQDAEQQAERAVQAAAERVGGHRTDVRELVLHPRLVVRGTTAAVRSGA